MPINRDPRTDGWFYRKVVRLPDGTRHRLFGTPAKFNLPNTKAGAEEAERLAIAQVREHGSVEPPPPPAPPPEPKRVPTLAEFAAEHWLPASKVDNKPTTLKIKRDVLRRVERLAPDLVAKRLDQVSRADLDRLRQALVTRGLSPGTINTTLLRLRHLFGLARSYKLISEVPDIAIVREPPREVEFLSQAELDRLLAAPVEPIVRLMILVAAQTGLRIGELRALEWDDLDLERRRLIVRRTWTQRQILTPKSGRTRYVPLPPASLASLATWRTQARSKLVFPAPGGGYITDKLAYAWLGAATTAAGVRPIGWHILRHTYASHLAQRRVPLRAIQKLLGHSTIVLTERYSHLTDDDLHDAVTVLDETPVDLATEPRRHRRAPAADPAPQPAA